MFRPTLLLAALFLASSSFAGEDLSKLKWETNWDDPPIGDPAALKGGTFLYDMDAYPLTFRIWGPNANDAFAGWERVFSIDIFGTVMRHPVTDHYIPVLATEWCVMPDNKTVYYRIDKKAKWNDGQPITADEYAYFDEFLSSDFIQEPFYKALIKDHFESVEAVSDDVIKVVGKHVSWRPLTDFAIYPIPKHAIKLDADWIKRDNYAAPIMPGPYVIPPAPVGYKEGEFVEFHRLKDWWGDKHHYLAGMYNPDKFRIKVVVDSDKGLDYLKKGEISFVTISSAKQWATEMDFPELKKGWVHRKRVFVDNPQGIYGLVMNLKDPLLANKDFRKGLQHLFNFDELNKQLMFGAYYRQYSAFTGTEYVNSSLKPYTYDPKKAKEHLKKAGFAKRGPDGILVNDKGVRASFTCNYGTQSFTRHMTVIQNQFKKAGVEMKLQLLEPATNFKKGQDKQYQMHMFNRTANFYPDPHQYFSSEFKDTIDNNNVWGFGDPEIDKLIDVYRFDMDFKKRKEAMDKIDARIHDEAITIQFWDGPFIRCLYWDYLEFPKTYFPKRTQQMMDWLVMWINPDKKAALDAAMKAGKDLGEDKVVDVDPYGVKAALDAKK